MLFETFYCTIQNLLFDESVKVILHVTLHSKFYELLYLKSSFLGYGVIQVKEERRHWYTHTVRELETDVSLFYSPPLVG